MNFEKCASFHNFIIIFSLCLVFICTFCVVADLPDALQTDCAKCTSKQIEIVRRASKHLMEKRPADWEKLQQKFDPESKYQETFARFLKEETAASS